ncbi:TIGR03757 family integrating conjugative element protein [Rodentibacter trehalosifermentans]|uniref:TIGR03757 family integrating conjugative element protein n=1 Tax=Rodentibacter trehalosifermentans TaxID=1908263 RepID=UPI000984DACC|nr:TIGR03757 family integrating conjugative element protein [Rodentibacter trehalosifermentans]OOF52315.1 integrating conjugative element protein [Rodentibacter trehalosifermentans]
MLIKKSLFLLVLPFSVFAQDQNPTIIVYSTQYYPVSRTDLASQIYYLDQIDQWEDKVSRQLSTNPAVATQQAEQFFQSAEWKLSENTLKQSYQGILNGWQNGIRKVPAILFRYPGKEDTVIYGEVNIAKAKQQWQRWMENGGHHGSK